MKKGNVYFITLAVGLFLYLLLTVVYLTSSTMAVSIVDNSSSIWVFDSSNPYYTEILCMTQMMFNIPLVGFFIFILRKELSSDIKNFRKNAKKFFGYIIIGLFACYLLTTVVGTIYELLGITGVSDNQTTINDALYSSAKVPMILSVILFAPFVEEILFRKLLFGTVEEKFKLKPIIAIIASTLVFSLIHVSGDGNLIYIFQYIPLAFVITYSYYISGRNIYVPIGIHFLNNLISILLAYLML